MRTLICLLTPWYEVFSEHLIHCHHENLLSPDPIMRKDSPVHIFTTYFSYVHFQNGYDMGHVVYVGETKNASKIVV
jgi:hypothetical protein